MDTFLLFKHPTNGTLYTAIPENSYICLELVHMLDSQNNQQILYIYIYICTHIYIYIYIYVHVIKIPEGIDLL